VQTDSRDAQQIQRLEAEADLLQAELQRLRGKAQRLEDAVDTARREAVSAAACCSETWNTLCEEVQRDGRDSDSLQSVVGRMEAMADVAKAAHASNAPDSLLMFALGHVRAESRRAEREVRKLRRRPALMLAVVRQRRPTRIARRVRGVRVRRRARAPGRSTGDDAPLPHHPDLAPALPRGAW
jgi:hypothetical protein